MITNFNDFIHEGFFNRNHVDKEYFDMESEFEPNEPLLKKIYYNELVNLYKTNEKKYKLILKILKSNKEANKNGKKPNFFFFKSLLKFSESELTHVLKTWIDNSWYLN